MPLKKIIRKDKLETLIFSSEKEAGKAAAVEGGRYIAKVLEEKSSCTIIFAAAVSQHEMLTALSENTSIDWRRVNGFHMDEYIGLPRGDSHTLAYFFSRYPAIAPGHFHFIDPQATDYQAECLRYSRLMQEMPPDLVFCGVGDNGHLAFNEP
ncbi:MAG: 6-phosphogluconolactonase, partial [Candidatus Heritagella sp.]